jgi:exopolyphosphatase / guanosine-5'-triphosphate,3'-diphosphate pyrophosphatase
MKHVGVIDIGTNSVKLLVASVNGRPPRVLRERVVITRLGEGLGNRGRFSPRAMTRTLDAVRDFVAEARQMGVSRPVAVGTAAFRSSANRDTFQRRLRILTGIDMKILSGAREAELSYAAAVRDLAPGQRVAVIDVGGGSTEIAWDEGGTRRRLSLPLGAVKLTEKYLPTDPIRSGDFQILVTDIRRTLAKALRNAKGIPERVVAVGGTASTIAAMQRGIPIPDPARIHGLRLSRSQLYVWLIVLSLLSARERMSLPGLEAGRADIIVAGAAVLAGVLGAVGAPELTISTRGLRYGLLLECQRQEAVS